MRLYILVLFILTHIAHSFALTVILEPYKDIDYENINVYDYNEDVESDCTCHYQNFIFDKFNR